MIIEGSNLARVVPIPMKGMQESRIGLPLQKQRPRHEADLLYAARNQDEVLCKRGNWTGNNMFFDRNPLLHSVNNFSFAVTYTRVNNTVSYNAITLLNWGAIATDNYAFGLQTANINENNIFILHRLNNFNTHRVLAASNGSTIRVVGRTTRSQADFFTTLGNSSSTISPRPYDNRAAIRIGYNPAQHILTNIAWWSRLISDDEKNQYLNNTIPLFQ